MSGTPAAPAAGDITVEFAGDVHFAGRNAVLLDHPATAFGPIAATLADADITAVNLETAITTRGTEQPKEFHFRAPTTGFDAIRAAGIDVVTLANNHMLDYGRVGLDDTLAAAKAANFPTVGAGADADAAWAPWITEVKGTRFAFIGVSYISELASSWVATPDRSGISLAFDQTRTLNAIRAARKKADVVIVFMHWGTEGESCPNGMQTSLAKRMVDAGAHVIIGSHVHTLQGSGWLGHSFVAYGMGNFLWWRDSWSPQTGIMRLTFHPGATEPFRTRLIPAVVGQNGQPVIATGPTAAAITTRYDSLRGCAGLAATPTAPTG